MGRLEELRVLDPVLTTLARGYSNVDFTCESLFPMVEVAKESGKIPTFGKEAFRNRNTERAIRAKSNRISPEGRGSVPVVLDEHDLEYPIDYREAQEDIFDLQSYGTNIVTEGIRLRCEIACANLATTAANYPTGHKVTLSGTALFSDYTNSDPAAVIETGKEAVRKEIGRKPNILHMGASTFSVLKLHPKLLDRVKYTMKGVLTVDLLKELFDVDQVVVGGAIYADDAGVSHDIWGPNIVLAYVPNPMANNQRSIYEPSFGYTVRKKGMPEVDTYNEANKLHLVRSTDIFKSVIVGADAGYLISNTN